MSDPFVAVDIIFVTIEWYLIWLTYMDRMD